MQIYVFVVYGHGTCQLQNVVELYKNRYIEINILLYNISFFCGYDDL